MDLLNDETRVTTPPVTVVEIVSPGQSSAEMMKKVHGYLARGVPSFWLVDPSLHQVIIFIADGTRRVFSEGIAADPVTGITADLAMVFFMTRTSGAAAGRPDCGLHRAGAWQNMGGNKDSDNEHS